MNFSIKTASFENDARASLEALSKEGARSSFF